MMNLQELLEKFVPLGINVKIGSGANFLYCGACDSSIFDKITKISDDYYKGLQKRISDIEGELANFDDNWDKKIERELRICKFSKDDLKEKLLLWKENDLQQKQRYYNSLRNEEAKFTPFLTRKIKKVYNSIPCVDTNCKIVLFFGREKGKYWTIKEYEEDNK